MRYVTLASVIGLALVIPARGQGASNPKDLEKAAKKACATGDFRKGVEILAELYVDTNDATYVFNQGRCYEQNHQWVSAIDRFREYLRHPTKATAEDKADAEKHLADCEALRQQDEGRLAPAVAPSPLPAPAAAPASPLPPAPAVTEQSEVRQAGAGLRVTGIVLASLGVAATAAGLVLNLEANSLGKDYNNTQDPGTKSSYSSYKTGAWISYGAGGALWVAGAIFYLVGLSEGRSEHASHVALMPVLTPSQSSLSLVGRF